MSRFQIAIFTIAFAGALWRAVVHVRRDWRAIKKDDALFDDFKREADKVLALEPIPMTQRFRMDPDLKRKVDETIQSLVSRANTDPSARLALEQLILDELVIVEQRGDVLSSLSTPTPSDVDELTALRQRDEELRSILAALRPNAKDH